MQNLFMRIIKTDRSLLNIAKTVQDFPPLSLCGHIPLLFTSHFFYIIAKKPARCKGFAVGGLCIISFQGKPKSLHGR